MATWHIGITGGIGSGKSTLGKLLADHGAFLIDADALSRASTAAGGAAMPAICQTFGNAFANADGSLNRDAMRELVFRQPQAKAQLETIVHPIVVSQVQQASQQACSQGYGAVLYDIPLLAESSHWRTRLQHVVVVDCEPEIQITRVMQRNHLERHTVLAIMQSQASRAQRLAIADSVVFNGASISLAALQEQAQCLARSFGLTAPKGYPLA